MSYYEVVNPGTNFRGRSYGEWASEWWKWLVSDDPDLYYRNSRIVFLRANIDYGRVEGKGRIHIGKHYDRTKARGIEIYDDTAIFFPVIEAEFSYGDPYPEDIKRIIRTEEEMRRLARKDIDEGGPMGATIRKGDGPRTPIVHNLKDYRAESPLFRLVVSRKNPLRKKMEFIHNHGTFYSVTDGYWILIRCLCASSVLYEIHFEAEGRGTQYSATYHIAVKPRPNDAVQDKSILLGEGSSILKSQNKYGENSF
jgi:hypothetical protein